MQKIVSGQLKAANDSVILDWPGGCNGGVGVQLDGTFVGTVVVEGTINGVTWVALKPIAIDNETAAASFTTKGIVKAQVVGLVKVRVRCSLYTSGTVEVTINGMDTY